MQFSELKTIMKDLKARAAAGSDIPKDLDKELSEALGKSRGIDNNHIVHAVTRYYELMAKVEALGAVLKPSMYVDIIDKSLDTGEKLNASPELLGLLNRFKK